MANQILNVLIEEIAQTEGVEDSAIAFIVGVPKLLADGIAAALANGATEADLQPLTALKTELEAKRQALAAAIVASGGGATQTRSTKRSG